MSQSTLKKRRDAYFSQDRKSIHVDKIRFTQRSIKDSFSSGTPIKWTIYMLESNQIKPMEIPLIRIGYVNGQWRSIDNRRLYCYKTAHNIDTIPVFVMKKITKEFYDKDQSQNDGKYVKVIKDHKMGNLDQNIVAYDPITSFEIVQIRSELFYRYKYF